MECRLHFSASLSERATGAFLHVVQPFTATSDPRVLGIKPIPNLDQEIQRLLKKYRAESRDIEDIDFEEPDIEEAELFPLKEDPSPSL